MQWLFVFEGWYVNQLYSERVYLLTLKTDVLPLRLQLFPESGGIV